MASLNQFSKRMYRLGANVAENADRAVRSAALMADQVIVLATPVDTGRARANWIANLDTAVSGTTEAEDPTGQAAMDQASGVIAGYDGARHTSIHITNNLPYIEPLNDGSSAQAPAGFVQKGVQAAVAAIGTVRILDDN